MFTYMDNIAYVLRVQTAPGFWPSFHGPRPATVLLESVSRIPSWEVSSAAAQNLWPVWFEHRNRGGAGAYSADEPMLSTRVIAVNLSTGAVAHLYEGGPDVNLFRGDEANETQFADVASYIPRGCR